MFFLRFGLYAAACLFPAVWFITVSTDISRHCRIRMFGLVLALTRFSAQKRGYLLPFRASYAVCGAGLAFLDGLKRLVLGKTFGQKPCAAGYTPRGCPPFFSEQTMPG